MFTVFRVSVGLFYVIALAVALSLPNENQLFLVMRFAAIVASIPLLWAGRTIAGALLGGAQLESEWWAFLPLVLYFSIIFGLLFRIEYRLILRQLL